MRGAIHLPSGSQAGGDITQGALHDPIASVFAHHDHVQEMGATAARLLRRLMDEPDAAPRRTEPLTELIARGSTAAPPRDLR